MKKLMLYGLIACAGIFAAGCDGDDMGSGSIGVGIGIGVGDHHGHYGSGGYYDGDHYHGGHHHGGYPGGGYGGGGRHGGVGDHHGHDGWSADTGPVVGDHHGHYNGGWSATDPSVSALAAKYQIPMTAAQKITDAFAAAADQGSLDSFRAIGLNDKAFKAMMTRTLPSDETVKAVSANLGMTEEKSRSTLTAMMRNFSAQAANINSEYWQHCMADGQWKTDKNRSCSSTSWSGCSPAKGAQFCY